MSARDGSLDLAIPKTISRLVFPYPPRVEFPGRAETEQTINGETRQRRVIEFYSHDIHRGARCARAAKCRRFARHGQAAEFVSCGRHIINRPWSCLELYV